ncbi:DoxX family protein [Haloglycomyces albus]|uniref:DoxX family protein n=1 Tax=Haloglycomyces albus TaxID=526067 RepID=UPI00046D2B35|nr:DoxX family protein [Haloglycomyces albus]
MAIAHIVVTVAAALWVGFSAYALLSRAAFVVEAMEEYGVPRSWWSWLGWAKAAGAVGLIVGLVVPAIGIAAAIGLVVYFTGAVITVLRARAYRSVVFPILYLVPSAAALVLAVLV